MSPVGRTEERSPCPVPHQCPIDSPNRFLPLRTLGGLLSIDRARLIGNLKRRISNDAARQRIMESLGAIHLDKPNHYAPLTFLTVDSIGRVAILGLSEWHAHCDLPKLTGRAGSGQWQLVCVVSLC